MENKQFDNQKELFKDIRETRPRVCGVCGKKIYKPMAYCFSHILPKGYYPEYKLDSNNIITVDSIKCHEEVDMIMQWKYYLAKEMLSRWLWINILRIKWLPDWLGLENEILHCKK